MLRKIGEKELILFIYFIVVLILVLSFVMFFVSINQAKANILFKILPISFILSFLTLLILFFNTHIETIYDGNWKEIYSNNIQTNIYLSLNNDENLNTYKAGDSFEYEKYNFQHDYYGYITAYKDNISEKKKVYLKKSNIKIEGKIKENSTISKIEYRKVTGKKITLFNINERLNEMNYDGELRIEISPINIESKKELKNLFE